MHGELVIDASVMGAAFFTEAHTSSAQEALGQDLRFVAPDLLLVEMASLASKKVRRNEATSEQAARALEQVRLLISEFISADQHYARAFELAAVHGLSAYDGLYLALAQHRGARVVTADNKLIQRATQAGLQALVTSL